jgi:hypothetical protein
MYRHRKVMASKIADDCRPYSRGSTGDQRSLQFFSGQSIALRIIFCASLKDIAMKRQLQTPPGRNF